ncbi:hypothetical protein A1OE_320 [Candidatus Endolissoclinum faulkneri L2]|uniref:Uncharacterized protein n=1 Tax=Candidatus Endolissoclinum faulkneri L2 TaxID=1193729 RepID=K7YM06_9PROT|nr:hypothetical protein A1OE_320 [Candidatus Endolissoclinum faulkneri L2]
MFTQYPNQIEFNSTHSKIILYHAFYSISIYSKTVLIIMLYANLVYWLIIR